MCIKYLVEFLEHPKFPIWGSCSLISLLSLALSFSPSRLGRASQRPEAFPSHRSPSRGPALCSSAVRGSPCSSGVGPTLGHHPFTAVSQTDTCRSALKGHPKLNVSQTQFLISPGIWPVSVGVVYPQVGTVNPERGHTGKDSLNLSACSS